MRKMVLALACASAPALLAAQAAPPPAAVQVSAAVLPLPAAFRADATVFGYEAGKRGLVTLREGRNPFICLADDPNEVDRFHVACYHDSLEPFMLRGRELRAQGVTNVDSARYAEIASGRLVMAKGPAALYSLTAGEKPGADGTAPNARPLYVIYVPFASTETTGLPARPDGNKPWLMFPGTAKAHIMFTPTM